MIYNFLRNWSKGIFLAFFFFLHSTVFANDFYENFTIRSNDKRFQGITLRVSNNQITIATSNGIRYMSRNSVFASAKKRTDEVMNLDKILDGIEHWLIRRNPQQVELEQIEFEVAFKAYERLVEPKLRASSNSEAMKTAIRNSLDYYGDYVKRIPFSIKIFRLNQELDEILKRNIANDVISDTSFIQLVQITYDLDNAERGVPRAEIDRRKISAQANALINQQLKYYDSQTRRLYARVLDADAVVKYIQILRRISPYQKSAEDRQNKLVEYVLNVLKGKYKKVETFAFDTLVFKEGKLVVDAKDYDEYTQNLRAYARHYPQYRQVVFGQKANELKKVIQQESLNCFSAIRQGDFILGELKNVQILNGMATYNLGSKKFDKCIEVIGQWDATFDKIKFDRQNIMDHKEFLRRSATLQKFYVELKVPTTNSTTSLINLRKDADNYLTSFEKKKILEYGVTRALFKAVFDQIDSMEIILVQFADLDDKMQNGEILPTWELYKQIQDELTQNKIKYHPLTHEKWKDLLELRYAVFKNRMYGYFNSDSINWEDPKNQKSVIDFIKVLYIDSAYTKAHELIRKIMTVWPSAIDDEFSKELTRTLSMMGVYYNDLGKFNEATKIFEEARRYHPEYLDFADELNKMLVDLLVKKAETLENEGQVNAAMTIYTQICNEFPNQALKRGVFDSLINIKVKPYEEMTDRDQAQQGILEFLEVFTRDYPEVARTIPYIKQVRETVIGSLNEKWEEQSPNEAMKFIYNIYEKYPTFTRVSGLIRDVGFFVYKKMKPIADNPSMNAPGSFIDIIESFNKYEGGEDVFNQTGLADLYLNFKIRQAKKMLEGGAVLQAFAILHEIKAKHPKVAESYHVDELLNEWEFRYKIAQIETPLGIVNPMQDWSAFVFWILFFIAYFVRSLDQGRRYGHIMYSLKHFFIVFTSFIFVWGIFLSFGKLSQTFAVALAFTVLTIFFNGLGFMTLSFFPLIYVRRKIALMKKIIAIMEVTGGKRRSVIIKAQMETLEEDLPYLHDVWLFKIQRCIRLSQSSPQGALNKFDVIRSAMHKDLFKKPSWKENYISISFYMGQLAWQLDHLDQAKAYLNEHLEGRPRDPLTHEVLGEIYFKLKQYDDAVKHYKVCVAADTSDDSMWYKLGYSLFKAEDFSKSAKCFESMSEQTRDSQFIGARAFASAGNFKKSIEWFQRLIKENPDDGEVIYYLASSFAQETEDVKAFKIIRLIKENDSFYPQSLALQGMILFRNGKLDLAKEEFRKALELNDDLFNAQFGLGQIVLNEGDLNNAKIYFENVLTIQPDFRPANYFYGVTLERLGLVDEAIPFLEDMLDHEDFGARAAQHLAKIVLRKKDLQKGLEYYSRAKDVEQSSSWSKYLQAYCLISTGRIDDAKSTLNSLLQQRPVGEWKRVAGKAFYTLGRALYDQFQYTMAGQCFSMVRDRVETPEEQEHLEELILETRFRVVLDLLENHNFTELDSHLDNMITDRSVPTERKNSCKFYKGISCLFQKNYAKAVELFGELIEFSDASQETTYHLAIAFALNNQDDKAENILSNLQKQQNQSDFLNFGLASLTAYQTAQKGNFEQAGSILNNVILDSKDENYKVYNRHLKLNQMYYMCKQDLGSDVQAFYNELNEDEKSGCAYYMALYQLEQDKHSVAFNSIKAFTNNNYKNNYLFGLISAEMAVQSMKSLNIRRAKSILSQVRKPREELLNALEILKMAEALETLETPAEIGEAINVIRDSLKLATDRLTRHAIIHNLTILTLMRAIIVEETTEKNGVEELWQNFWFTWEENVFDNRSYWNNAQKMLVEDPNAIGDLTSNDIAMLNSTVRYDVLLQIFIGYTLSYLYKGALGEMRRHVEYIMSIGRDDNRLEDYMKMLSDTSKNYVEAIDKNDPVLKTWDFVINYIQLRMLVNEVLDPKRGEALRRQFEGYKEYRNYYSTPGDFVQAKKMFQSSMLDAMQAGMNKKFSNAGDKLEKCLKDLPKGIVLNQFEEEFWNLRDRCKDSGAYAGLEREFEQIYKRFLTFTTSQ